MAAAGAALVVFSFVSSFVRFVRRARGDRRFRFFPVVVNVVAMMFLVVLPLMHLLRAMTAPGDGAPRILAAFGDWLGSEGYPRPSPHRGVDIAGSLGTDVLAAADGRVTVARDNRDLCGLIIVIDHDPHGYRTVYCHFSVIAVRPGDSVKRGQRIGAVGTSGQRAWPGFEHARPFAIPRTDHRRGYTAGMSKRGVDIASLTPEERLSLLEELWDSLAAAPEAVPLRKPSALNWTGA